MRHLLVTALFLPSLALAVPLSATHQGHLADSAGTPLEGTHDLTVSLWDAPSGGNELWSDTIATPFENGFYAVVLGQDGAGTPLDASVLAGDDVFVSLSVDQGAEISPRQRVSSVPFAVRADVATSLKGGSVDATEIKVGGNTVISSDGGISWTSITDAPVDADSLADVTGCSDGQVVTWSGSDFVCGDMAGAHADLEGLDADDHIQYLNTDRHDSLARHTGFDISPSAVSIDGTSVVLDLGGLDLGDGTDDDLTADDVTALTGGGSADDLHEHPQLATAQQDILDLVGLIGTNDDDNSADTTEVTANPDGSVLERLEDLRSTNSWTALHGKEMRQDTFLGLFPGSKPVTWSVMLNSGVPDLSDPNAGFNSVIGTRSLDQICAAAHGSGYEAAHVSAGSSGYEAANSTAYYLETYPVAPVLLIKSEWSHTPGATGRVVANTCSTYSGSSWQGSQCSNAFAARYGVAGETAFYSFVLPCTQ